MNPALAQVIVPSGEVHNLNEGEGVHTGIDGLSAITVESNATLKGTGASISTSGAGLGTGSLSAGIRAEADSVVNLTGGTVSATGTRYTRGILAYDGSTITTDGTTLSTEGDNSHAVHAFSGASALIQGGSVSTQGSDSFGLYSQNTGSKLTAQNVMIKTSGFNGFGAFTYEGDSELELFGGSIKTSGEQGHGVVAGRNSSIALDGTAIETAGERAWGLVADQPDTSITATNVDITTGGVHAYGAYAAASGPDDAATIRLSGGSIVTANADGEFEQDTEARGYALFAEGSGATIEATGTEILTRGQRSYGAYAIDGASMDLNDVSITTNGFMAYGVYASGAGSEITANNVNVTTNGQVGDAAWTYAGGRLELNGGSYIVRGGENPGPSGELANGLVAVGGTDGSNDGVIIANGVTVETFGENSIGANAGSRIGTSGTSGEIDLTDSRITVHGAGARAARVSYGGTLTATDSSLTSVQGVGILLNDNATVTLDGTHVSAGQETFRANLNNSGQTQTITVGGASVATQNNGTLLQVNRTDDGADGVVELTLGEGSITAGDIIDEDPVSGSGGTDVTMEEGASWTGVLRGVRDFTSEAGGLVAFVEAADIAGNLVGTGSSYTFSALGGSIGGDVELLGGSSTTGGTIDNRIAVGGDVDVDEESVLGGNWTIAGNLVSSGRIAPGNSIGRISVDGDLTLGPDSVLDMEIGGGDADLIEVGGTADLAGLVRVTPLAGALVGTDYTIVDAFAINGTFAEGVEFAQPMLFVDAVLGYDATTAFVTMERNETAFASVAETSNQRGVAEALDGIAASNPLASAVAFTNEAGAQQAFDRLSGEIYASTMAALVEDSDHLRNAAINRLRAASGSVGAGDMPMMTFAPQGGDGDMVSANEGITIWGGGFGSWTDIDGSGGASDISTTTGGFVLGADTATGDWRLGLMAGFSETDIDGSSSSATSTNIHLGAYAGAEWGALAFRSGLAHTWHDIDVSRSVVAGTLSERLGSDHDAETFQAFAELGYRIDADSIALEPFVNLAYVDFDSDGYNEGDGAAALSGSGGSMETTLTTLGLRASTDVDFGGLNDAVLSGMVGWRHAFGDTGSSLSHAFAAGDSFGVKGASIAEDALLLEAGLSYDLSETARFGIATNGQFGSGVEEFGLSAQVGIRF